MTQPTDVIAPPSAEMQMPIEAELARSLSQLPGAQEISVKNDEFEWAVGKYDTTEVVARGGIEQKFAGYICADEQVYSVTRVHDATVGKDYTVINRYNALPTKDHRAKPELIITDNSSEMTLGQTVRLDTRGDELYLGPAKRDSKFTFVAAAALEGQRTVEQFSAGKQDERKVGVRGLFRALRKRADGDTAENAAVSYDDTDPHSPYMWSAKTADVREAIDTYEADKIENVQYAIGEGTVAYARKSLNALSAIKPEQATVLREVILKGTLGGISIDPPEVAQRNAYTLVDARLKLAEILTRNPQLAAELAESGMAGYHGTRSSALAGVLKEGYIGSGRHLREQEAFTMTGEHIFQSDKGQGSISFSTLDGFEDAMGHYAGHQGGVHTIADLEASVANLKEGFDKYNETYGTTKGERFHRLQQEVIKERQRSLAYIKEHPDSIEARLTLDDFPVVFGITKGYLEDLLDSPENADKHFDDVVWRAASEYGEFQVKVPKIEKRDVALILVPAAKVQLVEQLCAQYGFTNAKVRDLESMYGDRAA